MQMKDLQHLLKKDNQYGKINSYSPADHGEKITPRTHIINRQVGYKLADKGVQGIPGGVGNTQEEHGSGKLAVITR